MTTPISDEEFIEILLKAMTEPVSPFCEICGTEDCTIMHCFFLPTGDTECDSD